MNDLQPTFSHYFSEGSIGGQCAVFAEALVNMPLVGNTIQTKTAAVKQHGLPPQTIYLPGDVLVLNVGTTAGHVAVVNCVIGNQLKLSESNWKLDLKVHHTRMILANSAQIVGIFRSSLKVQIINPTPMTITKKILVLLSHAVNPDIQPGIQRYCDKVFTRTNGEFQLAIDYANTDAQFHTIHAPGANFNGTGTDVIADTIFVDPAEIGAEGIKVEQSSGKQYDAVCLIYDPAFIIGDQPNHPVDNPVIYGGFNPFQIPTTWIFAPAGTDLLDRLFSVELFFAHENSHSDFYIINTECNMQLHDKTHDPHTTHQQITQGDDPADYFIDLLLELKPYWNYLSNSNTSVTERNPMQIYKFDNSDTEYLLVGDDTLIGLANPAAVTKTLKGRPQKLVVLPAAQKANFVIADSAIN